MDNLDNSFDLSMKREELIESERRFRMACQQIILLNHRILDLQVRYKRARQQQLRPFQYNLRLRLSVVENIRNVYYDYAFEKADRVAELRRDLYGEVVEIVYTSDDNQEHSDNES